MGQEFTMSRHALRRSQQRGITVQMIEAVLEEHDLDFLVGDDCRALRLSRAAAARMRRPETRQVAEKLPSIAIIWSDRSGQIVTVLRDTGRRAGRRYRGRV